MRKPYNSSIKGALLALAASAWLPCAFADNYSAVISASNPVIYYRFGEAAGTGTVTSSGSAAINGTVNSATLGATGPGGAGFDSGNAAVTFAGSTASNISLDTHALAGQLNGSSAVTVEMWINPATFSVDGFTTGDLFAIPVANTGSTYSAGLTITLNNNGDIILGGRAKNGDSYQNKTFTQAATGITLNTWSHLAAIFDYTGKSVSLYVNGGLVASYTVNWSQDTLALTTSVGGTHVAKLGGNAQTNSASLNPYNGSMDEFALYNKALSAEEVLAHYNASLTAIPEPATAGLLIGGIVTLISIIWKRRQT